MGSRAQTSSERPPDGITSVRKKLGEDDPLIGRVLDARYRIEGVLGAGGVGVVYRAEHTGLRRPVALKVLRHGFEDVSSLRRRFEREARILSQLSHPNIVALTDYGICEGMPYLVMELLEGLSLADFIDDGGAPDPHVALDIARGVLRGMAFAHGRGILHRDLKPGNVFLQSLPDEPHHPKLLDFGLAKLYIDDEGGEGEPTLTKAGTIIGTPAYMAPEQAAGGTVDARADVYAAGVLLFELLTGRPPFVEDRRSDLFRSHMVEPVPDPASMRPGLVLSRELQELLLTALAKEPVDRPADCKELLERFDALPEMAARMESGAIEPRREQTLIEARRAPPKPPPTRIRWVLVAAAAMLLLGGAYWLSKRTPAPTPPPVPIAQPTMPDPIVPPEPIEPVQAVEPPEPVVPVEVVAPADPFDEALPRELAALQSRLERSTTLDREVHRAMRVYQRLHPDDARPSLLLGRDFVRHNAWPQAIERYELSLVRNENARNDPQMLTDLLEAATSDRYQEPASAAIHRIFGERAIERVRVALAGSENRRVRTRLRALLERLESGPAPPSVD